MDETGNKLLQTQREKFWHERDREEKLEGLRQEILRLFHMVQGHQDAMTAFMEHEHSASGKLLGPLDRHTAQRPRHTPPALNAEQPPTGAIHGR